MTLAGTNPESFVISGQTCTGAAVAPGATCTASVRFAPTAAGARSATLRFTSDAPGSPHSVALSGTGTQPQVQVTPSSLTFPNTSTGAQSTAQTVTVKNTGSAALNISSVSLTGADAASFVIASHDCTGRPVSPGATCKASIRFAPKRTGAISATLQFASDAPGSPHAVALSGTGTKPPCRPVLFGLFCV